MKTIIISDIHNRVDWIEPFLSSLKYDRVVFLGDYFDEFNDTLEDTAKSAEWLKQSLHKPNRVHLFGTHDIWYRFPHNNYLRASGNTEWKAKVIEDIISEEEWDILKLYHFEQDFYMTHAGIHPLFADVTNIRKIIKIETDNALNDAKKGIINAWLEAGEARGGFQKVGGLTWLDWDEEFEPISHINQIVGHTTHHYPVENNTKYSKNYCIDTKNEYIGILENGNFLWKLRKNYQ